MVYYIASATSISYNVSCELSYISSFNPGPQVCSVTTPSDSYSSSLVTDPSNSSSQAQGALNICSTYVLQSIINNLNSFYYQLDLDVPLNVNGITITYKITQVPGAPPNPSKSAVTADQTFENALCETLFNAGSYSFSNGATNLLSTTVSGKNFLEVLTANETAMLEKVYSTYSSITSNSSIDTLIVSEAITIENSSSCSPLPPQPAVGSTWYRNSSTAEPQGAYAFNSINYSTGSSYINGQVQCIVTSSSAYYSKNYGETWTVLPNNPPTNTVVNVSPDGNTIKIANQSYVYAFNVLQPNDSTSENINYNPNNKLVANFSNTGNYLVFNGVYNTSKNTILKYNSNNTNWDNYSVNITNASSNPQYIQYTYLQVCDTGMINNNNETNSGIILILVQYNSSNYLNQAPPHGMLVSIDSGTSYTNYILPKDYVTNLIAYPNQPGPDNYITNSTFICMSQDGNYQYAFYIVLYTNRLNTLKMYYVTNGTEADAWAKPSGPIDIFSYSPPNENNYLVTNVFSGCSSDGKNITCCFTGEVNKLYIPCFSFYSNDYGVNWTQSNLNTNPPQNSSNSLNAQNGVSFAMDSTAQYQTVISSTSGSQYQCYAPQTS